MRPEVRCWILGFSFLVLTLAGCSTEFPIDEKHKWEMKPNEIKWFKHPGPQKTRKVFVIMDAKPYGANVMLAIIREEDLDESKNLMRKGNEPLKFYESHGGGDKIRFEPILPGKEPFVVLMHNASEEMVTVTLRVTSRPPDK